MRRTALMNFVLLALSILVITLTFVESGRAADLKVMKVGLGSGTIASTAPGQINCGVDCDQSYPNTGFVTLTAVADPGSTFAGWSGGGCSGVNSCGLNMNVARAVRATFTLDPVPPSLVAIPPLTNCGLPASPPNDCSPENIQAYLDANLYVDTAAEFIAALPLEYKENWILMPRSESLQTGTAQTPRILMPSADTRFVFSLGLKEHASFPGAHPDAIEYMQWDATQKNFRFHEIVLKDIGPERERGVTVDDAKCTKCHSTQNVPNTSEAFGTAGTGVPPDLVKAKNKPNWDTYDSWGGMMPFNRDRIYQGSVEEKAFKATFNLWNWRGSVENDFIRQILEQLELQPTNLPNTSFHTIERNIDETGDVAHITFGFEKPGAPAPPPPRAGPNNTINYNFNNEPGAGASTVVNQEARYVTLRHSLAAGSPNTNENYLNPSSDEGRGVELFDRLTASARNPMRIADELVSHQYATGSFPIDIRPIALAIAKGCVVRSGNTVIKGNNPPGLPNLNVAFDFFNSRHGISGVQDLLNDTLTRQRDLPRRKADIQKLNLDRYFLDGSDNNNDPDVDPYLSVADAGTPAGNGLIQEYAPGLANTIDERRREVFRRSMDLPSPDNSPLLNGFYVDREIYTGNAEKIALYRYFLEPLGVSVDKWSMSVRGRSRTYTFADLFGGYTSRLTSELRQSLRGDLFPGPVNTPIPCEDLINDSNVRLAAAALPNPAVPGENIPTFTDVQRIFNKSCIECHGDLRYPPYVNYSNALNLSEKEREAGEPPQTGWDRMGDSYDNAASYSSPPILADGSGGGFLFQKITMTNEDCPHPSPGATRGMMPCGGPPLSNADIETIRRWINGGSPKTAGDPHIKTIDGINYDFQADGEYILLSGPGVEVQVRHTAVETAAPYGPNGHTGLTSCVSVNGAVAVRVGRQRITYQPNLSGVPDPDGLQLRIDGKLVKLGAQGVLLAKNGRIIPTSAPRGLQIEAPGGTRVVITPKWWSSQRLWFMNIDIRHARGTRGLMGAMAPGNWLPAMPDGSFLGPRPQSLQERYDVLYGTFGNAWRVTNENSLFDYAPGTSTNTFRVVGWPRGESPASCDIPSPPEGGVVTTVQPPIAQAVAEQHCAGIIDSETKKNCVGDVSVTGEVGFAQAYLLSQELELNRPPAAPVLTFPEDNAVVSSTTPVSFDWDSATDADGDAVSYRHCVWPASELYDSNKCVPILTHTGGASGVSCTWWLLVLAILLLIVLVRIFVKKRPQLALLAIVLLLALVIVYLLCPCGSRGALSKRVTGLKAGQTYYWKVLADDGKGGTTESRTFYLDVK